MKLAVPISAKKTKGDNCQMCRTNNVKTFKNAFLWELGNSSLKKLCLKTIYKGHND